MRHLFLLLLAASLPACTDGGGSGSRPKNVLLISIDTLRPDHLGCYGYGRETSPALDRLAAEGALFQDVSSTAPWTLPAHATMLTGLYPSSHGVKDQIHRLRSETVTLAEELGAAGLRTFGVVNSFNVGGPAFQLGQGFETFLSVPESALDPKTFKQSIINAGPTVVAEAQRLLDSRRGDEPFFLFLHFYDVHTDFTPEPRYRERFVSPYAGALTGDTRQLLKWRSQGTPLDEADIRFLREMYDAEIRQLDDVLAGFFEHLREQGLYEDTLVVVTSDHGEEYFEHGGLLHGRTQYQELVGIPLLMRGPGVPRGVEFEDPVGLVDVVPTILGLMGIESTSRHDGLDLSAPWRGGTLPAGERILFSEADHNNTHQGRPVADVMRMVRRGNEKVVLDARTFAVEYYDLGQDPGEQDDRAPEQKAIVEELMRELQRFSSSAVTPELIPPPSAADLEVLNAAGYVGDSNEKDG